MSHTPVVDGLLKYINENNIPFHMPGHKNNRNSFSELEIIRENLYGIDVTEVPGVDNLHIPGGIILEGQRKAAQCYGAEESFFLVNGSTCGIYSMIMGVTRPGDKIILQRNCHRSVYMACLLGDLNTVFINPTILDGFDAALSLKLDDVKSVMDKNPDAKAVVLTYPTFYGTCCNLEGIVQEAHKRGMLVLVDEAHGAHFYFNGRLPKGAMKCGADASVVSMHKTTPALTQTALLNIGSGVDRESIKFMLRAHQSTSPSYILMASIDSARKIMEDRGGMLLDEIIGYTEEFKEKMKSVSRFNILDSSYIGKAHIYDIDRTRLVIKSDPGGRKLEDILRRKYHIQVEMSDLNNIVLICSVGDTRESFDRLYEALMDISKDYRSQAKPEISYRVPEYKTEMTLREAYYSRKRRVKLREAAGLVNAEMVVPYPPGIPVLIPGEVITYDIIEYIEYIREQGIPLNGISDSRAEYIDTAVI